MNDERLKQMGGGGYWKELLDCIRDIRSSEKVNEEFENFSKFVPKEISQIDVEIMNNLCYQ